MVFHKTVKPYLGPIAPIVLAVMRNSDSYYSIFSKILNAHFRAHTTRGSAAMLPTFLLNKKCFGQALPMSNKLAFDICLKPQKTFAIFNFAIFAIFHVRFANFNSTSFCFAKKLAPLRYTIGNLKNDREPKSENFPSSIHHGGASGRY